MSETKPDKWPHGIRCRCEDVCKELHSAQYRQGLEARARRLRENPALRPHGDANTYHNWLCRCDPCTKASGHTRHVRRNEGRLTPSRRLPSIFREDTHNPGRTARFRIQPFGREWLDSEN